MTDSISVLIVEDEPILLDIVDQLEAKVTRSYQVEPGSSEDQPHIECNEDHGM